MARGAQCDTPLVMVSKVFSLYKMDALGHFLMMQTTALHMSAKTSASAVVVPVNTKKIGEFLEFFQKW